MASNGKKVRVELPNGTRVEMLIDWWSLHEALQSGDQKAKELLNERAKEYEAATNNPAPGPSVPPPRSPTPPPVDNDEAMDDDLPDPAFLSEASTTLLSGSGLFGRDNALMLLSLYMDRKEKFNSPLYKKKHGARSPMR